MNPIAIVGYSCRFPLAQNLESFWQVLKNGKDAITEVPPERWCIDAYYHPDPATPGKMNTRWGGFLEEIDRFDAEFFQISQREAKYIDPQHRLLLEVAWEALENANIPPHHLAGTKTGVFIGIGNSDYSRLVHEDIESSTAYNAVGTSFSIAANRISYFFNFKGPSLSIDTACSSSLVALHYAGRSLESGESDLCIVGGVNLILSPEITVVFSQARMMAKDGRCKTFDSRADGYVRGDGCGVVVLKRLEDALRDGDRIEAILRGSAVVQDGLTNGITAPNGLSQQETIRQALENSGLTPNDIDYVEAHGTGTPLGDPIEMNALKAVFESDRSHPCWLGSVKTNIGHTESAAGLAGLIKTILSLKHRQFPPHLHLEQLNPYISLEGTSFIIPTRLQDWPDTGHPRRAGISSFGFGGTNCHVIVEEAPERELSTAESLRPVHLLALSAKKPRSLRKLADRYRDYLDRHPDISLASLCATGHHGREHFPHRLAIVTDSLARLQQQLTDYSEGRETFGAVSAEVTRSTSSKIAFLFTGQGSQYRGMGAELYRYEPRFRQTLDYCAEILTPYLTRPLLTLLFDDPDGGLDRTEYTQPALFALEYSLARLWESWGVHPALVAGHSVGEYVAACIAGVFSLEDGLKLIAARGKLMASLPDNGAMVAVRADETEIENLLAAGFTGIAIAALNGPENTVVSGKTNALEPFLSLLEQRGIAHTRLKVSRAFHSPEMEPIIGEFAAIAHRITYSPPELPLVSLVTGQIIGEEIARADYWCRHIIEPVRFARGIETIDRSGYRVYLEIGAKPILSAMGRACLEASEERLWLPSLHPERSNVREMLGSLARLYCRGVKVDWRGVDGELFCRQIPLPTYPFDRQRFWYEKKSPAPGEKFTPATPPPMLEALQRGDKETPLARLTETENLSPREKQVLPQLLDPLAREHRQPIDLSNSRKGLYEIRWRPAELSPADAGLKLGCWLILADNRGIGEDLARQLRAKGSPCFLAGSGEEYEALGEGRYRVNFQRAETFARLWQEIENRFGHAPLGIIDLFSLNHPGEESLDARSLQELQLLDCVRLLALARALNEREARTSGRLWAVTRRGVEFPRISISPTSGAIWGLGKTLALDYPNLWGGTIDLDEQPLGEEALSKIFTRVYSDGLAIRDGRAYVPRLARARLDSCPPLALRPDATYLVTGGLGGLGWQVVNRLIERGARSLAILGRGEPSPTRRESIERFRVAGIQVSFFSVDVADEEAMGRAIAEVNSSLPPLRGIIHAAGTMNSRPEPTPERKSIERILRPKVMGVWNLHHLTRSLPLDFFVTFSSIAAVWGSKGQAEYAAANSFLDRFVHYRRQRGLVGTSINWGPWAGEGMASEERLEWLNRRGIRCLEPSVALAALETLLQSQAAQVTVADVDWNLFQEIYRAIGSSESSLFLELKDFHGDFLPEGERSLDSFPRTDKSDGVVSLSLARQLASVPIGEHPELLRHSLRAKIARVLDIDPERLDENKSLMALGFDSLMAIELKNFCYRELDLEFSISRLMEGASTADITAWILERLSLQSLATPTAGTENDVNDEMEEITL